jgi:formylglycine-generating enzyme required for sulfatase activity
MAQRLLASFRPGDQRRAGEFAAALSSVPKDLPANPLLLTLLAAVSLRRSSQEPHALPRTRGELYDRALTLLIEDWVKEHNERFVAKDAIGLDSPDLRRALQLVARRAQERSTQPNQPVLIERTDFYAALDDIGKGETTPTLVTHLKWTAGMLLDQVEQSPGAMASPAPGRFRFLHLSFQEYLAACDMLYRPGTANARAGRLLWDERPFPEALVTQVFQGPRLWANVLRLAVDELLAKGRVADAWEVLALCCQPYQKEGSSALAALLALDVAHKAGLFTTAPPWAAQHCYQTICDVAKQALVDRPSDGLPGLTPEQRDIAGQLLGSDPFPGHDARKGVGLRKDGLPDIDWIMIPEIDRQTGKGEWTYQNKKHKPLETFWIGRYPITYAQFEVFLRANDGFRDDRWWRGLDAPKDYRSSAGNQAFEYWNHPRERVSWWDAMAFCAWLTDKAKGRSGFLPDDPGLSQGWRITLPTEQQWEKAARGHDGRQYPWGNNYEKGRANIDERYQQAGTNYLQKTTAVGMYPHKAPDDSPYGVADLSGNVWEWCLNEYSNPERVQLEGDEWRVLRGGSWYYVDNYAAAPFRHGNGPNYRGDIYGFRVCAVLPPP